MSDVIYPLGVGGPVPYPTSRDAPKAPDDGSKVTLRNVSSGEQIERWAVDARVLVESGEWTTSPPPDPA
jgi:hypothetical protein